MQRALMLGNERFLPERGNTRGWPHNRRQLEFALCIVRDGLSPKAAYRKIYVGSNSDDSLNRLNRTLMPFLAYLQERKSALAEREFDVTNERLLREVSAVALANKVDYMRVVLVSGVRTFIGREPDTLTRMQQIAVSSWTAHPVETDHGPEIDYRYHLHPKRHAVDFLGRHLGMLSEKLLVEMMGRRNAQQVEDYSKVSNDDLNSAIDTLKLLKQKLANSAAIDVTPERVVHSLPGVGGSRDEEHQEGGSE